MWYFEGNLGFGASGTVNSNFFLSLFLKENLVTLTGFTVLEEEPGGPFLKL